MCQWLSVQQEEKGIKVKNFCSRKCRVLFQWDTPEHLKYLISSFWKWCIIRQRGFLKLSQIFLKNIYEQLTWRISDKKASSINNSLVTMPLICTIQRKCWRPPFRHQFQPTENVVLNPDSLYSSSMSQFKRHKCAKQRKEGRQRHTRQTFVCRSHKPSLFPLSAARFLLECAMDYLLLMSFLSSSCEHRFFHRHPWCYCHSCHWCKLKLAGGFTYMSVHSVGLLLQLHSSLCLHYTTFGLPSHSFLSSNI